MFFTVSDDQIPCLVYISFKSQTRAKNKKGQSIDIKMPKHRYQTSVSLSDM